MDKSRHQVHIPIGRYLTYMSFYDSFDESTFKTFETIFNCFNSLKKNLDYLIRDGRYYTFRYYSRGSYPDPYNMILEDNGNTVLDTLFKDKDVEALLKKVNNENKTNSQPKMEIIKNEISSCLYETMKTYDEFISFEKNQVCLNSEIEISTTDYTTMPVEDYMELKSIGQSLNDRIKKMEEWLSKLSEPSTEQRISSSSVVENFSTRFHKFLEYLTQRSFY